MKRKTKKFYCRECLENNTKTKLVISEGFSTECDNCGCNYNFPYQTLKLASYDAKRYKEKLFEIGIELNRFVKLKLETVEEQIKLNLPPSTYTQTISFLNTKVEEIKNKLFNLYEKSIDTAKE